MSPHPKRGPVGGQADAEATPARPDPDEVAAWQDHAEPLADHYLSLRVRDDIHGRHYGKIAQGEPLFRYVYGRYTAKGPLTRGDLTRHFRIASADHIVGLHVTSPEEMCRVCVVDVDAHDDQADPSANLRLAMGALDRAREAGFDALLLDSDGAGGHHVWVVFDRLAPMAHVHHLGRWLVHDYARFGFGKPPETFPKNSVLTGKRCGNWVRIPGRHHKRRHWTKAWDPRRRVWVAGEKAVRLILGSVGKPVDIGAAVPDRFGPGRAAVRRERPRPVAVYGPEYDRLLSRAKDALRWLGPDYYEPYDAWLMTGLALSELGPDGLDLWHDWSKQSEARYDPDVLDAKWESFTPGVGVTLLTLFHHAAGEGWDGPAGGIYRDRRPRGSFSFEVTIDPD